MLEAKETEDVNLQLSLRGSPYNMHRGKDRLLNSMDLGALFSKNNTNI